MLYMVERFRSSILCFWGAGVSATSCHARACVSFCTFGIQVQKKYVFFFVPRIVVSTAAFHARIQGSFPGGLKATKMFLPHPLVKLSIVGSLRDREVACSASDLQGLNFESCVWRAVSSHSSHHPQEVFLARFSLHVHTSGLKPDSFNFIF